MSQKDKAQTESAEAADAWGDLPDNVIYVFGEKKVLHPLQGFSARMMFPKILGFVADMIAVVSVTPEITWDKLLKANLNQGEIVVLLIALSKQLANKWENFEKEMLPFILQLDDAETPRLQEEGELIETYWSAIRALRYYINTSLSKPQMRALKALFAEGERRKN